MAGLKQYNLKLGIDLLKTLKREAKRLQLTQSQLIRLAVQEKLKRIEREKFVEGLQQNKKTTLD
jgi:hypothetical protein